MRNLNLREVLSKELVTLDHMPFRDKSDVFSYVAETFAKAGIVSDKEEYIKSLNYRETLGSTYMGNFIALPHGKCKEVKKTSIAFCRCTESFLYKSCDEIGEVKYIFAFAIEESKSNDEYIVVLSTIASYLVYDESLKLLENAKSFEEIVEGFEKIKKEKEVLV